VGYRLAGVTVTAHSLLSVATPQVLASMALTLATATIMAAMNAKQPKNAPHLGLRLGLAVDA